MPKVERYSEAGVRLVWCIDPGTRTADVDTGPAAVRKVSPDGTLDGGDVLPGFELSLQWLFEEADGQRPEGASSR
jgi:hypothetical protein